MAYDSSSSNIYLITNSNSAGKEGVNNSLIKLTIDHLNSQLSISGSQRIENNEQTSYHKAISVAATGELQGITIDQLSDKNVYYWSVDTAFSSMNAIMLTNNLKRNEAS
jgi:hypothetical protein